MIGALLLRNLTVLALTGKTLAGKEVRSSLLVPINEANGDPVPVIAVFTDTMKTQRSDIRGRDILGADAVVTLALEVACIGLATTQTGEGPEVSTYIPETDEGMEMTIDIIMRQAVAHLQTSSDPLPDLWRQLVTRVSGLSWERGAGIDKSVKFAARRLEIDCELLSEPTPGEALTGFWDVALAALATAGHTNLANTIRTITAGEPLPEWRRWQAELGLTNDGMRSTGVAPIYGSEDSVTGAAAATTKIEVEAIDRGDIISRTGGGATSRAGEDGEQTALVETEPSEVEDDAGDDEDDGGDEVPGDDE